MRGIKARGTSGGGSVAVSDDGTEVVAAASGLNFGTGLAVTDDTGGEVTVDLSATGVYSETVGDGTTTAFTITHGLSSQAVVVATYDLSGTDPVQVEATVELVDDNNVRVTVGTAPGTDELFVVILGNAVASGGGGGGTVAQQVSTTKTDTWSEAVAGAPAESGDVTGLTVEITPTSSTNSVEVNVTITLGTSSSGLTVGLILYRDGSPIIVGDTAGSRPPVTAATQIQHTAAMGTLSFTVVDTPATTSPVTYSVRLLHGSSTSKTLYVNRTAGDSDGVYWPRAASAIHAREVTV